MSDPFKTEMAGHVEYTPEGKPVLLASWRRNNPLFRLFDKGCGKWLIYDDENIITFTSKKNDASVMGVETARYVRDDVAGIDTVEIEPLTEAEMAEVDLKRTQSTDETY